MTATATCARRGAWSKSLDLQRASLKLVTVDAAAKRVRVAVDIQGADAGTRVRGEFDGVLCTKP